MDNVKPEFDKINNEIINIHEYYEVEHWTKEFHTNVEALKDAVEHVGNSIPEIKKYLNN